MVLNDVIKQANDNNEELSRRVRMLEFEKNKLKLEIGKRDDAGTHDDF